MKREELVKFLSSKGLKRDRFGHFKQGDIRYKIQKLSIRKEKKRNGGWIRIWSDYYKNLEISPKGKIRIKVK